MTSLPPMLCAEARSCTTASSSQQRCIVRNNYIHTHAHLRRLAPRIVCASYRKSDYGGPAQQQQERWKEGVEYAPASGGGGPPRLPPDDKQPDGNGDAAAGMSNLTKAFVAGAFILGMGAGIWFDSEVTFEPNNVASTVLVDTKTPNSEVCMANGYSSMVLDQRLFVSFNPFNVYVSQPQVKPGCVLRRSNVNVLESRGLVDNQQVQACKRNMNTFAFVGDLSGKPEVSCVYHSEEAENEFLRDPRKYAEATGIKTEGVEAAAEQAVGGGSGFP